MSWRKAGETRSGHVRSRGAAAVRAIPFCAIFASPGIATLARDAAGWYGFGMQRTLALLMACAGLATAQDFVAPAGRHREIVGEIQTPKPSIEGMVKEIFTKKPWQAVNPLAPQSYGSGEKLVSRDFGPGTPHHSQTLTVVGIEW